MGMTTEDFFIVETFEATPERDERDEAAVQGELFAISTYRGPKNRGRRVENVAMIDVFGHIAE